MHYLLLLIRHRRAPEEHDDLFSVVADSVRGTRREEVDEMAMTDAQSLVAQGRKEGRLEMLLEQLEDKFGPVPPRVRAAVEALPQQRLREMARRLLTAQDLSDLQL